MTIHRIGEDDYIEIKLELLFNLIRLKYKIPYIDIIFKRILKPGIKVKTKLDTKKKSGVLKTKNVFGLGDLKEAYRNIKKIHLLYEKPMNYILSKTNIKYLNWETKIGLDDAAFTAIAAGIIWTLKSNVLSFISSKIVPKSINLYVTPSYSKTIFEMNFDCIIRMKIANIIIAGAKILAVLMHSAISNKGGEGNERTSYSRVNEDYNG